MIVFLFVATLNRGGELTWPRLFASLIKRGVKVVRRSYGHVDSLMSDFPNTTAIFNCTGLGARHLGGVEDTKVHPTKASKILPPYSHPPLNVTDTDLPTGPNNPDIGAQETARKNDHLDPTLHLPTWRILPCISPTSGRWYYYRWRTSRKRLGWLLWRVTSWENQAKGLPACPWIG